MHTNLNFEEFARLVVSQPLDASWQPAFVQLSRSEAPHFIGLCRERQIVIIDAIDCQLSDLAMVRLPSEDKRAARKFFIDEIVAASGGRASYGTWVYFPWEAKIVHLLNAEDYFDVITNRNQDKITRDEQRELRAMRIGVVGLSVGAEAAVTVAQEHLCGHIVLADFDRLDLSNLNRLHASCDELGYPKTTIAARRIVKIDPYVEITVFEEGVTAENAEQFLDGLDLLIEECDNPQLKRDVRLLAKERGINVVYAADERGFFSVEPYREFPELRPFHGRVAHPQPSREDYPTPVAFFQALAEWIGGWENLSQRTRHSLQRVGDDLCGYPHLAS